MRRATGVRPGGLGGYLTNGLLRILREDFKPMKLRIAYRKNRKHYAACHRGPSWGIRGILNKWFASYLKRRFQTNEVKNCISEKQETLCGVPQGSVLCPLLFLIYTNDICNSSNILKFYIFADDTNLLHADNNLKNLEKTFNKELAKVSSWLNVDLNVPPKISLSFFCVPDATQWRKS